MGGADWEKPSGHRQSRAKRRTVALLVGGVLITALVARAVIAEPPGTLAVAPEPSLTPGPSPSPRPSQSARPSPRPTPTPPGALPGEWETFPPSPLGEVFEVGAVSTGSQVLMWGGVRNPFGTRRTFSADGAAFDIDGSGDQPGDRRFDGSWRSLPPAPLAPRVGHAIAWTGAELVVWGGQGATEFIDDGAAYDPGGDLWRPLATSPLSPRAGASAVWTGAEMVVLGGWDNAGSLDDSAAYDPITDSWRPLAPAPPGLAGAYEVQGLWDGESVVVWTPMPSPNGTGLARYRPDEDRWTSLPAPGRAEGLLSGVVWSGRELYAVHEVRSSQQGVGLWSLPKDAPAWQERPSPPLQRGYPLFAVWTGSQLAVVADDSALRAQFFDPAVGTWSYSPPSTLDPTSPVPPGPVLPTGEDVVVLTGGPRAGVAYPFPPVPSPTPQSAGTAYTVGS